MTSWRWNHEPDGETVNGDLHQLTGAYVLDSLDDLERQAFERHLDSCEACRAEVHELSETVAALGAAEGVDAEVVGVFVLPIVCEQANAV